jgi:DNA-binding GntR family transcriptional regulator
MVRQPTQDELKRAYYYDILKSCASVVPAHTRVLLEPILLDRNEAKILNAPPGSAALKLERLTTSGSTEPVLLTRNVMAGDHSRYVLEFDVPATEREAHEAAAGISRRRRGK